MDNTVLLSEFYIEFYRNYQTGEVFIMDETDTFRSFDLRNRWDKKRFDELKPSYITVTGKEFIYHVRGNMFDGKTEQEKYSLAVKWASWYHKHRGKLPRWNLLA